jgi:hypothetical protein
MKNILVKGDGMNDKSALVPVEERTVIFYDDELTAVLVRVGDEDQVFVPVRPLCDYLGVDWSAQRKRIVGDPVLSEVARSVAVTATEAGGKREMLCLPLELLNGWLFGVNATRVKPEIRERLIRYQKECYRVLAKAFVKDPAAGDVSPATATLLQVREMGRAIMQMAEEQIEFERRLTTTEGRIDQAAVIVGDLNRRVASLEQRVAPGKPVTEDQASQISQAVKAVALVLTKRSGSNQFGGVYGELYRKFGITSYKMLPAAQFDKAMKFLTDWHEELVGEGPF